MNQSRAQRDAAHNASLAKSLFVSTSTGRWIDFGPGVKLQVLRTCAETGQWRCLFLIAAGSTFGRHEHLGPGEFFLISGKAMVDGGVENGGLTSLPGDYRREPSGVVRGETSFPEDSLIYFSNDGPIKFLDGDDNLQMILDWRTIRAAGSAVGT